MVPRRLTCSACPLERLQVTLEAPSHASTELVLVAFVLVLLTLRLIDTQDLGLGLKDA